MFEVRKEADQPITFSQGMVCFRVSKDTLLNTKKQDFCSRFPFAPLFFPDFMLRNAIFCVI